MQSARGVRGKESFLAGPVDSHVVYGKEGVSILKKIECGLAFVALIASLFTAKAAHAQQVVVVQAAAPPPAPVAAVHEQAGGDGGRFRGGIELDAGLFKPPAGALGGIGPSGQIGYQINNLIGVYAVPGFTILFGSAGGLDVTAGAVVDFTILNDALTIGAGPEVGAFAYFGTGAAGGGAGYGGRIHAAWNALVSKGQNGVRRKGLVVGLDLRFIVGPEATASASTNLGGVSASASTTGFTFAPTLSVGYVAF